MTDNAQSMQIEELVLTLHALIEQQQELLADSQAQGQTNEEYIQKITSMIKQLTDLLKTYQNKEQLVIANTNQALRNNISLAFQENQENYHALMNKGFTTHIDTATKQLSTIATKVEKQFEDLEIAAHNSKTEFESRQGFFKMYENTYDTQSRQMKESVDSTTTAVINSTKNKLDNLGSDFSNDLTKKLSKRLTIILSTVCFSVIFLTFGLSWLFVPSKAEISDRQTKYNKLAKALVAHNVIEKPDGYYARVNTNNCIEDESRYFKSKSRLCKFD